MSFHHQPFQSRSAGQVGRSASSPTTAKRGKIDSKYKFTGFISSGTYGRVYRAQGINGTVGDFAIKKFKPDKEGERGYVGISQSAIREMAICAEISHPNLVKHIETILEDKSIYMVFVYCEHDLLQIVHRHSQQIQCHVPASTIKSIMYQLLKGCQYLHENWIMHRDLKPANIMVTAQGQVMIGDLGLARIFREPLVSLWQGDKVVVTIWYRAPELLMGAHHYTPAIDLWAVGCIFAELLCLRPVFKGEEVKVDNKKTVPFQKHQMHKIIEVMGVPNATNWPTLSDYPDMEREQLKLLIAQNPKLRNPIGFERWFTETVNVQKFPMGAAPGRDAFDLLSAMLHYDPTLRITAAKALEHAYFAEQPSENCFEGSGIVYPGRKIVQDEAAATSLPGTKRSGLPDDTLPKPGKRLRQAGIYGD